jgi:hypothetical protein
MQRGSMHTIIVRRGLATVAAAAALVLAGCGDSGPTLPLDPEIQATESSIFLGVGQSQTINVAVVPAGAAFEAMSDDTEVATVTQASTRITISGVGPGFATVTLVMVEYPWAWHQIAVEVTTP